MDGGECPIKCGGDGRIPPERPPFYFPTESSNDPTCTKDDTTKMTECAKPLTDEMMKTPPTKDTLCKVYQDVMACYPSCYCDDANFKDAIAAAEKAGEDAVKAMDGGECPIKCGGSGSTSPKLLPSCPAADMETAAKCSEKLLDEWSETPPAKDKVCGKYNEVLACFPTCFCISEDYKDSWTGIKQAAATYLAEAGVTEECAFQCGPPPPDVPEFAVTHSIILGGISAADFNKDFKIIRSFQESVANTLSVAVSKVINIKASAASRRQLSERELVASSCEISYDVVVVSESEMKSMSSKMASEFSDNSKFTDKMKSAMKTNGVTSVSQDDFEADTSRNPMYAGTAGDEVVPDMMALAVRRVNHIAGVVVAFISAVIMWN
jgi:hypothetical protein